MTAATCVATASPQDTTMLSVRRADGEQVDVPLNEAHSSLLADAVPWRTWRWYHGQQHYSGVYWSATERDHVPYESRLELARLTMADFDQTVSHIIAQPFLLTAVVDGVKRRHVPDYLEFRATGLTVVDVKPKRRLKDPKVAYALGWAKNVVEDAGWQFEVFAEPDESQIGNVKFFAGYRLEEAVFPAALAEMRARDLDGITFGAAVADSWHPPARARAALLHMLWRQELEIDMRMLLSAGTTLYEVK
jgi:hypothetical protein